MSTGLLLTVDEFDQMVERGAFDHLNRKIELIRGELRQMTPPGPLHDDVVTYLSHWSFRSVDENEIAVCVQMGMSLAEQMSRPQPDLLWVQARRYMDRHPNANDVLLAIEVSHSSLKTDLGEKAVLYAEAGIQEYWIVDLNDSCIHVFRDPIGATYRQINIVNCGETRSPLACEAASLVVSDLFEE